MNYTIINNKSEIIQKQDWLDIPFGKNYQVTYKIINNNIIHCKATGYCNLTGLKKALLFSDEIIRQYFNGDKYIYIEDFSKLTGIAPDARKYYMSYMKTCNRLLALVFHNVSPILKLSVKLAKWLYSYNFDTHIARDFDNSLEISQNIFKKNSSVPNQDTRSAAETQKNSKVPASGVMYESEKYTASYEMVSDNIIHFLQQGHMKAHDVHPVVQADIKLVEAVQKNCDHYYMIADIKGIKITSKARHMYVREIIKLYNTHPFRNYIFYGANWLIRSAINLSRSKVPFPVMIVNTYEDALELIANQEKKSLIKPLSSFLKREKSKKVPEERVKQEVDELMAFLGNINWETEGIAKEQPSQSALLAPIYEGIALLKMELDEQNRQRKIAQEQRVKLQKKLEHSMKMEAVGIIAGGVAHDLNNILGGIISYPEMMLMELPGDSPLREDIETIYQTGMKAAAIVQDLLTLTRRGVIVSEPVALNKVISDYFVSPEFKKVKEFHPGVEFKQTLADDLRVIDGSPVHLLKVLMNLVSNCAEAIEGKGKVEISTYNCKGDDTQCNDKFNGDSIVIKITDTGIGIAKDELGKIFEPFFTKKKLGLSGTGLGMAVVWNTINDHKGFIDVKSKLGKGTTFYLHFPISKNQLHSEKKNSEYSALTGRGQFILIVDDVPEQRKIASSILKKLGYKTDSVSSGEAAVEYITKKSADLLILDMVMDPGIDGLETYKQILNYYPYQKAVIASGYSEPESLNELFSMKNIRYIKKPYTITQLGKIIKDIIGSKKV